MHGGAPNWLTVLALLFVAAVAALYVMDPRTEPEPTWTPVARESASPEPSITASPEG